MGFYEWVASMRKKPIALRRRFAAATAISVMGIVTAVWFAFFFGGLGARLEQASQDISISDVSDGVLSKFNFEFPEPPDFSSVAGSAASTASSTPAGATTSASTTSPESGSDGF